MLLVRIPTTNPTVLRIPRLYSSLIPFSLRAPSRRRSCSGTPASNAEKERTREEHQRGGYRDERGTEGIKGKSETEMSIASGERT